MWDWLEDMGETVLDVGSQIALEKHTPQASPKPNDLVTATPSAYEPTQKNVAVNNNGAPIEKVINTPLITNNLLLGGSLLVLVVALILIVKK